MGKAIPIGPTISATDVCRRFEPGEEAKALLREGLTAEAYRALLMEKQSYGAAIQFMAYWLSKGDAIWWGCLCAWQTCRPEPPPVEAKALEAAVHWLIEPNEKNRRAAEAAGEVATLGTPAGCVAYAAFWSEGSMSLPGLPDVTPPPFLTAKAIAAALELAAMTEPERLPETQRLFLRLADEVLHGKNPSNLSKKYGV